MVSWPFRVHPKLLKMRLQARETVWEHLLQQLLQRLQVLSPVREVVGVFELLGGELGPQPPSQGGSPHRQRIPNTEHNDADGTGGRKILLATAGPPLPASRPRRKTTPPHSTPAARPRRRGRLLLCPPVWSVSGG